MRIPKWRHCVALLVIFICSPLALLRWLVQILGLAFIIISEGVEWIEDMTWRRCSDWANRRLI